MSSNTSESDTETPNELEVTFQPALFLQRRAWVLEILRREQVTKVLDIGCGEGELVSCLCNPAPWLAPPPPSILPPSNADTSSSSVSSRTALESGPRNTPRPDTEDYLHIKSVYALDVSLDDLKHAVEGTSPTTPSSDPSPNPGTSSSSSSLWHGYPRWEPLEVKIWQGRLESFNPEFVGIDCIVSTEVIEHLPEDILADFAPMLLGVYHPRLLLITTPSYTFNARFTAPDAPPGTRKGYPDPTGRTHRVFRHDDHQFEWTVEEFTAWCERVAEEWGYEVEVDGVGKAREKDEWGRDEELGYATQVAAFRKRESREETVRREVQCGRSEILERIKVRQGHRLLATHQHVADPKARHPGTLQAIGDLVKTKMKEFEMGTIALHELWFEYGISSLCGGWVEFLISAIELDEDLQLHMVKLALCESWEVHWSGFVLAADSATQDEDQEELESTLEEDMDDTEEEEDSGWSTMMTSDSETDVAVEQETGHSSWGVSAWKEASENGWGAPIAEWNLDEVWG